MTTPRPYDVLLADFGGVCLLSPVELHRRTERLLGLEAYTLDWYGPIDDSNDQLYRNMTEGELTERDYWARRAAEVGRLAGEEFDTRAYMSLIYDPPDDELIRPEATDVANSARQAGIGVSILTNDLSAFHGPDWSGKLSFFDLVDHLVDCSDTGILKPDPRAFQQAVDIIGVPADRILFVDDQPLNAKGAEEFGLDTVWFDIAQPARSWAAVSDRLATG